MINWKVRLKNRVFWLSAIPAVLILAQQVLSIFGVAVDVSGLTEKLVGIVGTVFAILALLGIVTDPTTSGVSDSDQALTYDEPKSKE